MKFLLVLLAVVTLATAYDFAEKVNAGDRSLSSQVVDWIEDKKERMPCGFPGLGLGPLSPAYLSHREIAIHTDGFDLDGEIQDFTLYDLDNFDVVEFKIAMITSKVTFKFHWHKVHFDTIYKLLMSNGAKLKMQMGGNAKFAIEDFTIWGTARYNILGKVRLREFKVYASIGNVQSDIKGLSGIGIINRKLNEVIEEWIMLAVNDNTDNMAEWSNEIVVPIVNDMIGDLTLKELLGLVGGGGNDGDEKPPQEPCVPPTRKIDVRLY